MSGDKDKIKICGSEMKNLSLDTSSSSRDFWRKEGGCDDRDAEEEIELSLGLSLGGRLGKCDNSDKEEEIELSLGLSLGGRLGIDKASNKLMRSSSIAECLPIIRNEDDFLTLSQPSVTYSRLVRTTSLPLRSDEELRKRKELELQTFRRIEAKRRRSKKQINLKEKRDGSRGEPQLKNKKKETTPELNLKGRFGKDMLLTSAAKKMNTLMAPLSLGVGQKSSQGSIESQGGGCSFEFNNRSLQKCSFEEISQSWHESNHDVGSSSTDMTINHTGEIRKSASAMEYMPYVFTKGDGPNGREVNGILYKYEREEELLIMCVCHGSFHSPAQFVKHAGGTDITHPLKHIVVNKNSTQLT